MPPLEAHVALGARHGEPVSPHLFGSFIEHFGRIIYDGLLDADMRPRPAVLDAVRALRPTVLRYPGGCFADTYDWRHGVGPVDQRPRAERQFWTGFVEQFGPAFGMDPDWAARMGPPEPNAFGTDEFLALCEAVGAEPALTANVGTGTAAEAADWVRYTKGRVRHWFLGNELYGGWEAGSCSAEEYGARAVEFAAAMRAVDPGLHLIAVGRLGQHANGGPDWNRRMLAVAGEAVATLSLHYYFPGPMVPGRMLRDDAADYSQVVAAGAALAHELDDVTAEIAPSAIPFALDEWNVWAGWAELLEVEHRVCDAIGTASCLNELLRRSGRIRMALLSQLVNCMGPIQTRGESVFTTPVYLAALLYRDHADGPLVDTAVQCDDVAVLPWVDSSARPEEGALATTEHGAVDRVPVVDAAAAGSTVFLLNRSMDAAARVTVEGTSAQSAVLRWIDGDGPFARNTVDAPACVQLRTRPVDPTSFDLPPHTAAALILEG